MQQQHVLPPSSTSITPTLESDTTAWAKYTHDIASMMIMMLFYNQFQKELIYNSLIFVSEFKTIDYCRKMLVCFVVGRCVKRGVVYRFLKDYMLVCQFNPLIFKGICYFSHY